MKSTKRELSETKDLNESDLVTTLQSFKKRETTQNIDSLPTDIWTVIFSYLNTMEKIRILTTNRLFYEAISSPLSWNRLEFIINQHKYYQNSVIKKILNETSIIQRVTIYKLTKEIVNWINKQKNLEVIYFKTKDSTYHDISELNENLQDIKCNSIKVIKTDEYLKMDSIPSSIMETVEFIKGSRPTTQGFDFGKFQKLKKICTGNLEIGFLNQLLDHKNIKSVKIDKLISPIDKDVVISPQSQLETIKLNTVAPIIIANNMNLKQLSLVFTTIKNIERIGNYKMLEKLKLSKNLLFGRVNTDYNYKLLQLNDLDKLKCLTINFGGMRNNFIDLNTLPKSLKRLKLYYTTIDDLSFLSGLDLLEEFKIDLLGNKECSLAPLKHVRKLEILMISNGRLVDQDYIPDLDNLKTLSLRNIIINTFTKNFKKLEDLKLIYVAGIENLNSIKGNYIKKMVIDNPSEKINLSSVQYISTIEHFETFRTDLTMYDFTYNFNILNCCKNLEILILKTRATDYSFLVHHPNLRKLSCFEPTNDDLKEIAKSKYLIYLSIYISTIEKEDDWYDNNTINRDIEPLQKLDNLETLKLTNCVIDVKHLLKMKNLIKFESNIDHDLKEEEYLELKKKNIYFY